MITYALAPSPKWYFLNAQGRPAAGGSLSTFDSLDHTTPKFVFSDAAGLSPYTDPIILDATGGTPVPMYWETTSPGLYYIVVKDKAGNIIFDLDDFPISGGGGVTPITSNVDIENHLVNGQFLFIDAVDETASTKTPVPVGTHHMAPGSGFFKDVDGNYVPSITAGIESGWSFVKAGGASATDTIRFVAVTAIGEGIPNAPSANATRYFEFTLSIAGDIYTDAAWVNVIPNVELFQNELLTVSFDTKSDGLGLMGTFEITQYFGTGGAPSASVTTSQAFTFASNVWARQSFQITLPNIIGKSKGTNSDDALFIRWVMPLNTLGTFNLVNHQIQRGTFALTPYIEQTYAQDEYKVLIDLIHRGNIIFKTGELKWISNAPGGVAVDIPGWVFIQNLGDTLGSDASLAFRKGVIYKNLYMVWWNTFNDTECPVSGGRGGSANADFNANKTLNIPRHLLGTVITSAGQNLFGTKIFGDFTPGFATGTDSGLLYYYLYVKL